MGKDKAQLVVDGIPMAVRVADALRRAGAAEVWAVGGDASALQRLGLEVVPDEQPGEGPLPATITALRHAQHPMLVVLACDLLHPSEVAVAAVLEALARAAPEVLAAVPLVTGHLQWTHAAWRASALGAMEAARATGARSLRKAGASLTHVEVHDLEPVHLADADSPADLTTVHDRTPRADG
jgi:molybdopterin-guanine dinucleotide biosynthesis protein A